MTGAIPDLADFLDLGADDPSAVAVPDLDRLQLVGQVSADVEYVTLERLAQAAEGLRVTMSGHGWAAWVRSMAPLMRRG